jgi:hypothetical protein
MLRSWRSRAGAGGAPIVEKQLCEAAQLLVVPRNSVTGVERDACFARAKRE